MKFCLVPALIFFLSLPFQGQGQVMNLGGQPLEEADLFATGTTVLIYMSPECPLCENYSATLKTLRPMFPEEEVSFIGVFSGNWYSAEEIIRFMARYQPPVQPVLDPSYSLQQHYEATVTPEAVVVSDSGEIIYQGKIDNWIVSLGKKRTVVTEHYLRDALTSWSEGEYPEVRQTEAVGCFIE